jgi:AcrR family transcriptional regulator
MGGVRIQLTEEVLAGAVGDAWSREQVHSVVKMLIDGDGKFGPGQRGVPPELKATAQRLRMLLAMQRACAELGYRKTTVHHVLERAGVSRPTFYEYFDDKEHCFLLAFDFAAERLQARLTAAEMEDEEDWHTRLQATLTGLLRFVASEPDAARTLIIEARGANQTALLRHNALFDDLTECIDEGLRDNPSGMANAITAEGLVAGIEAVLYARLNYGETSEVEALLPALMSFAAPGPADRVVAGAASSGTSGSPVGGTPEVASLPSTDPTAPAT